MLIFTLPFQDQLEQCIIQKIPLLLQNRKIGLLIVDSIAAPYRVEYDDKELKSRAKSLRKIGQQLHTISKDYNVSVICINQVRYFPRKTKIKIVYQKYETLYHNLIPYEKQEEKQTKIMDSL